MKHLCRPTGAPDFRHSGDSRVGAAPRCVLSSSPCLEPLEARLLLDATWTAMVYLCASGKADLDILDIAETITYPPNSPQVDIVVQLDMPDLAPWPDGCPLYVLGDNRTQTWRGKLSTGQAAPDGLINTEGWQCVGEKDMGNPATLTEFVRWAVTRYPAQRYALFLVGHGGGIGGCIMDKDADGNLTMMTPKQLGNALVQAQTESDWRFATIAFDVCNMGAYEVAYELTPVADFMVATEGRGCRGTAGSETAAGGQLRLRMEVVSGLDYKAVFEALPGLAGGAELAEKIVDTTKRDLKASELIENITSIDLSGVGGLAPKLNRIGELFLGAYDLQEGSRQARADWRDLCKAIKTVQSGTAQLPRHRSGISPNQPGDGYFPPPRALRPPANPPGEDEDDVGFSNWCSADLGGLLRALDALPKIRDLTGMHGALTDALDAYGRVIAAHRAWPAKQGGWEATGLTIYFPERGSGFAIREYSGICLSFAPDAPKWTEFLHAMVYAPVAEDDYFPLDTKNKKVFKNGVAFLDVLRNDEDPFLRYTKGAAPATQPMLSAMNAPFIESVSATENGGTATKVAYGDEHGDGISYTPPERANVKDDKLAYTVYTEARLRSGVDGQTVETKRYRHVGEVTINLTVPKAYYRFERHWLCLDSSGNGNDLTTAGTAGGTADGLEGWAAEFHSAEDALVDASPGGHPDLAIRDELTVAGWARIQSCGETWLISNGVLNEDDDDPAGNVLYGLWADNEEGLLRYVHESGNGETSEITWTNVWLGQDRWHHLALTRDAGGLVSLYIDGTCVGGASAGLPTGGENSRLRLGGLGPDEPCPGLRMDEVLIYSRTLSAEDIGDLADYQYLPSVSDDLSVGGNALTMEGVVYGKGSGVRPEETTPWEHAYGLDADGDERGDWRLFRATIGLDDEVDDKAAQVGFEVYVQDSYGNWSTSPAYDSGPVGTGWKDTIAVDVRGAKAVKLVVRDTDGGCLYDHADWGDVMVLGRIGPYPGPYAVADDYVVLEDETFDVLAEAGALDNDRDFAGEGLAARLVDPPRHGRVVLFENGSFRYVPDADWNSQVDADGGGAPDGHDFFRYEVRDGAGRTDVNTVKLTVVALNDPPVPQTDVYAYVVGETGGLAVPSDQGVLINDGDVDADALTAELAPDSQPLFAAPGGFWLNQDGSFVYVRAADVPPEVRCDEFRYRIWDGQEYSNDSSVRIVFQNVAPDAGDDECTVDLRVGPWENRLCVLTNDTDADGDLLHTVALTAPQHGAVLSDLGLAIIYVPDLDYWATRQDGPDEDNLADETDTFTYTVDDGYGGFDTATITVSVLDTSPPRVTVLPKITSDTTPGLSGTVDDPHATMGVTVGGTTYQGQNNGDGTWMLPDDAIGAGLIDGLYDVHVTATDPSGNAGSDSTAGELLIDTCPPAVLRFTRDSSTGSPAELRSISFVFSRDVSGSLDVGDLTIHNDTEGRYVDMTGAMMVYDPATMTATWNLENVEGGLAAGWYTIVLAAAGVISVAGLHLDGNGDGTGGDDFHTTQLVAILGDANLNGEVDYYDYLTVKANFGMTGAAWADGDFDGDADVDFLDYLTVLANFGMSVNPA